MDSKPIVPKRLQKLISQPEILEWFKAHSSTATAVTQLEQLELFCRRGGIGPLEILALARKNPQKLKAKVQSYLSDLQEQGRASNYTIGQWWGVRSFLRYHEVAIPSWSPRLRASEADDDEEGDGSDLVPTAEQLSQILDAQKSARGRAATLLLATSGIRIGVLAKQHVVDGLRLKHLPDLSLDPEPHFERAPFLVRVPSHLAKGSTGTHNRGYVTFGTTEAAGTLISYLMERANKGERLTSESAVIAPDGRGRTSDQVRVGKDGTRFMSRKSLAFSIKSAMDLVKPTGVHWHAHTLRAWCSTRLEQAEAQGLISRTRREFFLGHSLGVDGTYNLNRSLSSEKVEQLRAAYARCEPYLSTMPASQRENVPKEVARAMLQLAGFEEEEIEKMDLSDLAAVRDQVRDRLGASDGPRQEVVSIGEVPQRLAAGWQFVSALGTAQAIVTSPSSRGTSPTPTASVLPLRVAASQVPLVGQSATGGSRVGAPQTSSGVGGPSLPPTLPLRVSVRSGEEHSVVPHRIGPERDSREEDTPGQG